MTRPQLFFFFFFFNDTATTEIYTLSLHDALPIWIRTDWNEVYSELSKRPKTQGPLLIFIDQLEELVTLSEKADLEVIDRKSTRLNSSHVRISYAVFCLKKKKRSTASITPARNPPL